MRWTSPARPLTPAGRLGERGKELHQYRCDTRSTSPRVGDGSGANAAASSFAGRPGLPRGTATRSATHQGTGAVPGAVQHVPRPPSARPPARTLRRRMSTCPRRSGARDPRRAPAPITSWADRRARRSRAPPERELRARAEPPVARNRPMHADVEPQVQPVVPREPAANSSARPRRALRP